MNHPDSDAALRAQELDDRYCFSAEATRILGIHIDTLKRLHREGKIPSQRFGNSLIFERSKLVGRGPFHKGRTQTIFSCIRCGEWVLPSPKRHVGKNHCGNCYSRATNGEMSYDGLQTQLRLGNRLFGH